MESITLRVREATPADTSQVGNHIVQKGLPLLYSPAGVVMAALLVQLNFSLDVGHRAGTPELLQGISLHSRGDWASLTFSPRSDSSRLVVLENIHCWIRHHFKGREHVEGDAEDII